MKKNLNKLATLALTGMMVAGMSFGAMAATNGSYTQEKLFDKKLSVDGKTFAPNTSFTFEKTAVSDEDVETKFANTEFGDVDHKTDLTNYLKGTTATQIAGITVSDATFTADQNNDQTLNESDLKEAYSADVSITVNANLFTEPGMYVMGLKENNTNYEGVVYNTTQYYLLINVRNKSANDALEVASVQLFDEDGVKYNHITNGYGGTETEDKIYKLNVKKVISGLGAKLDGTFNFQLSVNAPEGSKDGGYAVFEGTTYKGTITEGENGTLELPVNNNTTYTIYGLSESDEVVVKEKEASANGYATTYSVTGAAVTNNTTDKTNNTLANADAKVAVKTGIETGEVKITNNKSEITVTGVAMNIAPYAAMVLGAGAFAGIFLGGKRRKAEDED